MEKRRLNVWLGRSGGEESPKPSLVSALYRPPNPDRSRKACGNCFLFLKDMGQCAIHDSGVPVSPESICGFHVYGKGNQAINRGNMQAVSPTSSGLRKARGASCDRCTYYAQNGSAEGLCSALGTGETKVAAQGFCTFWTPKQRSA